MWKSRVKTVLIIRRNKMFSKIPAFYSKKLRNHLLKSSLHMYLLFNILTWFMNQVYLEKNIDDLIKEIDLFCCFKMCRLKTITFKLSNNIRKIYIFFHVNTTSRRKCSSFFPLRDKYICALWICPVCCKTYPRPWRIMQPCVFPCRRIV